MTQEFVYRLNDHGPVLGSRQLGVAIAAEVSPLLDGSCDLVLDFNGVEKATNVFVRALLDGVKDAVGSRLVLVRAANAEVHSSVAAACAHRRRGPNVALEV